MLFAQINMFLRKDLIENCNIDVGGGGGGGQASSRFYIKET